MKDAQEKRKKVEPEVIRQRVEKLLLTARKLIKHKSYVVAGSLSVVNNPNTPIEMLGSPDLDLYPKGDPGRAEELEMAMGPKSTFFRENGIYADAIAPALLTLPEGWEERLIRVEHDGVTGFYIDPDDVAVSKLARGNGNDLVWIELGLRHKVLDSKTIDTRIGQTDFLDHDEHITVVARWEGLKRAVEQDNPKAMKP